jgi:hypothetical protein
MSGRKKTTLVVSSSGTVISKQTAPATSKPNVKLTVTPALITATPPSNLTKEKADIARLSAAICISNPFVITSSFTTSTPEATSSTPGAKKVIGAPVKPWAPSKGTTLVLQGPEIMPYPLNVCRIRVTHISVYKEEDSNIVFVVRVAAGTEQNVAVAGKEYALSEIILSKYLFASPKVSEPYKELVGKFVDLSAFDKYKPKSSSIAAAAATTTIASSASKPTPPVTTQQQAPTPSSSSSIVKPVVDTRTEQNIARVLPVIAAGTSSTETATTLAKVDQIVTQQQIKPTNGSPKITPVKVGTTILVKNTDTPTSGVTITSPGGDNKIVPIKVGTTIIAGKTSEAAVATSENGDVKSKESVTQNLPKPLLVETNEARPALELKKPQPIAAGSSMKSKTSLATEHALAAARPDEKQQRKDTSHFFTHSKNTPSNR